MEESASGENIPFIHNSSPIFEWASGVPIDEKDITDEELRVDKIDGEKIEAPTLEYKEYTDEDTYDKVESEDFDQYSE